MITNKDVQDLIKYFEAKESRTSEENDFLYTLTMSVDGFPVTIVTREDLESRGFDTSLVSDDQMEELADKMCEDYCNQLFWESMETIADFLEFPRKEDDDVVSDNADFEE